LKSFLSFVDCYDDRKKKDCDDVVREKSGFLLQESHYHYDVDGEKMMFHCRRDFQDDVDVDLLGCVGHVADVK
jgi:hypothetical protein